MISEIPMRISKDGLLCPLCNKAFQDCCPNATVIDGDPFDKIQMEFSCMSCVMDFTLTVHEFGGGIHMHWTNAGKSESLEAVFGILGLDTE